MIKLRKELDKLCELLNMLNDTQANKLLKTFPVDRVSIGLLIGILTFTLPRKSKLSHRKKFFKRIRKRLQREEPDRVQALLEGLE
jgi:Mg2+/Co2+ transporter CorC